MNRMKYRIWLISLTLAAIAFGIFYYAWMEEKEKTVTDGTFVYRIEMDGKEESLV